MLRDFPFLNIDLEPGDVLYVPSFWWHLVQSLPAEDGLTMAYNYLFTRQSDAVYRDFKSATSRAEAIQRQMEGCIRGSKHSRVSTFAHPNTEVLPNKRERKTNNILASVVPLKRYKWSEEEEDFLTRQLEKLDGQWEKILLTGQGVFAPSRKAIHLYQKAREIRERTAN
jgi:hypothetical protein